MNAIQVISIILAIICFGIILFIGLKTDLLREKAASTEQPSCYSFSRFQLWIWTLIICPVFCLYWGFSGKAPDVNVTALILLGIPMSVTSIAHIVTTTNERTARQAQPDGVLALKHFRDSHTFWTDLLTDDSGQLSVARLQNLIFTIVYIVIYISMFFKAGMESFPDFEDKAFILMGISSTGYVLGKSLKK